MAVAGLREKYAYGEPIRAHVSLKYNNQDARTYLSSASKITAEVPRDDLKSTPFNLKEDKDGFSLEYLAKAPGMIRLKFTLFAKDKQNNDFLPRPSKEYRLEVLPRFYVEPEQIKFGDLGGEDTNSAANFAAQPLQRIFDERSTGQHVQEEEYQEIFVQAGHEFTPPHIIAP